MFESGKASSQDKNLFLQNAKAARDEREKERRYVKLTIL